MNKKIEDYLQYYIGQEVVIDGEIGELVSVINNCATAETKVRESGKHFQLVDEAINCKPILRPLSDMTDEEEYAVAGYCLDDVDFICTYRGMGYENDGIKIHDSVKCVKVETYCEHPEINNWIPSALLQIDYQSEKSPIIIGIFEDMGKILKDDMIEKPFDLTHYLLKQGFDLFGLIEANLAVDKTKEVRNATN